MPRQFRLAHKLIILVVLTTGVAVVVPSMLVIRRGTEALEAEQVGRLYAEARRASLLVDLYLSKEADELIDLSDRLAKADEHNDADQKKASVRDALRTWFDGKPHVVEVGRPASAGGLAWHSGRDGELIEGPIETTVPVSELSNYGLVAGGIERTEDGQVLLVLATRPTPEHPIVVVSKWRTDGYCDLLREVRLGQTGYAILVGPAPHYVLLAHPEYTASGPSPAYARPGRTLEQGTMVRGAVSMKPLETGREVFFTNEAGQRVVVAGETIAALGWTVVAEQSAVETMASIHAMERQVFLWGSTTGLIAVLLGLAIIRQITRPVESLVQAAIRVGEGDLTHPVGIATRDEIGQLALAFNEMQVRLRETYDKLERMVLERTHELQQTTDFLNSVLDSATEYSIIATDLQGTILSYNEGSRRIYGYDPDEIIGAPVTILIPSNAQESERSREILRHVRREGTYSGETIRVRKGGRPFPARFVITLRYDDSGKPVGYTTISRDITDRRELEAKLRQYTENLESLVEEKTRELQSANIQLERANRMKAEFLASMSHELRTPLNAIIGFADVLNEELTGPLSPEQKQFVRDILESGRQLLNLINDILDLSKVDAGRMELNAEDFELAVVFDEVQTIIQGMAVRKGLSLAFRQEPPNTWVRGDRVKLLQILYNLLSNAVKFTPKGGSIRVEAVRRHSDVCFRVIDTGVGIPADSLELIFEEFRQVDARLSREYGGTGLGLALTRKLVALHGGTLTVESEVDKGSVFTFTIPHVLPIDNPEPATAAPGESAEADGGNPS